MFLKRFGADAVNSKVFHENMAELEAKTGELDTKRKRQIQVMRGSAVETIEVDSRSGGTDMGTFE